MPLPNDVSRCLGERIVPNWRTVICERRGSCARYLDTGEQVPQSAHLCEWNDRTKEFEDYYIKAERI